MLRLLLLGLGLCLATVARAEDDFKKCTGAKEPDEKIKLCTVLVQKGDEHLAIALMNRGVGYLGKQDYANAIADLDKAVGINPQMSYAWLKRGLAHKATGKKDQAFADFTQAIEIDPELYEAYKERGVMKFEAGDKAGAIADYSNAIEQANAIGLPEPDLYCSRGGTYLLLGQNEEANADFGAAEQIAEEEGYCF